MRGATGPCSLKKRSFSKWLGLKGESYNVAVKSYLVWRRWPGNDYSQFLTEQQIQRSKISHWATCLKETRMRMHHYMKEIIAGRCLQGWKCEWISKRNQINLCRGIGHVVSMETVACMQPQLMNSLKHKLPEAEISNVCYSRDCFLFPCSFHFLLVHQLL